MFKMINEALADKYNESQNFYYIKTFHAFLLKNGWLNLKDKL